MSRILIKDLPLYPERMVTVAGWADKIRNLKNMQFLVVRDHTGKVQVVHEKGDGSSPITQVIENLSPESAILVTGKLVFNANVKLNQFEIVPREIQVVNRAEVPLPIQADVASLDDRLNWRFMDLRRPQNHLIFRIQTAAEHAMREFWMSHGFIEIHSPKLMGTPSESGAELFQLNYFKERTAYLAQSPQFYKQMAMAAGFDRVFEVGPVFRANPSFTTRHDTEFTSVDVEMSWINSENDVMDFESEWLTYVLSSIRKQFDDEISRQFGVEVVVPELPFPRIKMEEAYSIIAGMGHAINRGDKGDLDPEGERLLSQYVQERFGHEFVFVTKYPTSVRPFYHMRLESDPAKTKSFDLLWKGLEVTTGAQREHRHDVLVQQAREKGLNIEPIKFYLDAFRYGMPPHGGFGFGLTRMLMIMLGIKNVREVTYLYRGPNRLEP